MHTPTDPNRAARQHAIISASVLWLLQTAAQIEAESQSLTLCLTGEQPIQVQLVPRSAPVWR